MLALLLACTPAPDASSIERAVATSVPMAWVGTQALDAYEGLPSDCVVWDTECLVSPCVGAFELVPDAESCPLPIAGQLDGTVTVTVTATDTADSALFGAYFGDLTSDGVELWLQAADGAIATRDTSDHGDADTLISFTDIEVEVPEDGVEMLEAAWVVLVDEAGTLGDVRDDTLTLMGSSQWVSAVGSSAEVHQTVLSEVVLTPDCRRNPTGGGGGVQRTGAGGPDNSVAYDLVSVVFHADCDGQAEILAAGTGGAQGGSFTLSWTADAGTLGVGPLPKELHALDPDRPRLHQVRHRQHHGQRRHPRGRRRRGWL